MELRQLRYLVALAEKHNFTHAASAVHVTQSTLSHQIQQLEATLGCRLFDRSGRRVTLTQAGQALLPGVQRGLAEINSAVRAAKETRAAISGHVRVLVGSRAFSRLIIPSIIAEFRADHPDVHVAVDEVLSITLPRALEDGSYDVAIGDIQHERAGLRFEPLYREDIGLLVSHSHRLAGRKRVRMMELHREPLVLPTREEPCRLIIDACLSAVGAEPTIVSEMNMVEAVVAVARRNATGAIAARNMTPSSDDMVYVALEDPLPERTIGFLWPDETLAKSDVGAFANVIRGYVRTLGGGAPEGDTIVVRPCVSDTPSHSHGQTSLASTPTKRPVGRQRHESYRRMA